MRFELKRVLVVALACGGLALVGCGETETSKAGAAAGAAGVTTSFIDDAGAAIHKTGLASLPSPQTSSSQPAPRPTVTPTVTLTPRENTVPALDVSRTGTAIFAPTGGGPGYENPSFSPVLAAAPDASGPSWVGALLSAIGAIPR